jgi:GTPase SAR1 family protein
MITKDYQAVRKSVLSLYTQFKADMEGIGKEVSESIASQADKIEHEVFNLMVLGEAKSGKSTFINAYLGEEIVPMDVRQCTSAIIKIKRGDTFILRAKRADGNSLQKKGNEAIREFLQENAALSDQYRNIPVTYLNNEVLIKKHGNITEEDISKAIRELADDNATEQVGQDVYNSLIRKYIEENKNKWGEIITEIEIEYPLPEEMQGITIIDSPGVSAHGHVDKITDDYKKEANAIIFVKYLKGTSLESKSFINLFKKSTKQNKAMMFLVFTGKADLSERDFERLREQALELYGNAIEKGKIVFVDSKAQLILNKCVELGTREKIDEFFAELKRSKETFDPAKMRWYEADKEIEAYTEEMEELSNFNGVRTAIEQFAMVANYNQLYDFLESMSQEYKRYKSIFVQALKLAEENLHDPQALEYRITQKENEIAETFSKIKEGVDEVEARYTDPVYSEGIIDKESKKKAEEYKSKLANFKNLPSSQINNDTFTQLKTMTFDSIDDSKIFRREMADRVVAECNEKLIQYLDNSTGVEADAYIPNFSEADFDSMAKQAERSADKTRTETKSFGLREEKVPYHDFRQQVADEVKGIEHNLENIINALISNVVDYTRKCTAMYKEKLKLHYEELKQELAKLKQDKESNEKLMRDIEALNSSIQIVEEGIIPVEKMKEEIAGHVK